MAIGNNISALLGERRENITDLARGIHISYPAAHKLYHGKTASISFEVLTKLCQYFNVDTCQLFPYAAEDDAKKDR